MTSTRLLWPEEPVSHKAIGNLCLQKFITFDDTLNVSNKHQYRQMTHSGTNSHRNAWAPDLTSLKVAVPRPASKVETKPRAKWSGIPALGADHTLDSCKFQDIVSMPYYAGARSGLTWAPSRGASRKNTWAALDLHKRPKWSSPRVSCSLPGRSCSRAEAMQDTLMYLKHTGLWSPIWLSHVSSQHGLPPLLVTITVHLRPGLTPKLMKVFTAHR